MINKILRKAEKGQAIVIIAVAMVGLIAMVGLMTDGGLLLIEYGKLKRAIDSASVASAAQFRKGFSGADLATAAQDFLRLNQSDAVNIVVSRCKADPNTGVIDNTADGTIHDTTLCTTPRRKLLRVEATRTVTFGFLRVIGINSTTISAASVGEAASIDLVMVLDTSFSMAYETSGDPQKSDPGDDPALCNNARTCQPMEDVKALAWDFVNETMFFPYDRVAVVTMTSQSPNGFRESETPLVLSDDPIEVKTAIENIRVYEPPECETPYGTCRDTCTAAEIAAAGSDTSNPCYGRSPGYYLGEKCSARFTQGYDRSSCGSSNIGGALYRASGEFTRDPKREDSFWVVIVIAGGPANASSPMPFLNPAPAWSDANSDGYPDHPNYFGFCPSSTWGPPVSAVSPPCRDADADSRHAQGSVNYDADDYARDVADNVADPVDGQGITIFTIGLGELVRFTTLGDPDAGEKLLEYIAETAGDSTGVTANHGFYSYSPDAAGLQVIFGKIAENIFTRIAQ
jgi:hypothetical protein